MSNHSITVEKPKGRFRVVVTFPSGKKEVMWRNSLNAIHEIASEYMIETGAIKFQPMK